VSRVIRGDGAASPASRVAVLKAATELGYRPNAVARSLVQRRTYNVGVMVSDLHNIFFAEVLDGISVVARGAAYRVLIITGERDPEAEEKAVDTLLELRADGLILAGSRMSPEAVERVGREVPVAVVNNPKPVPGVDIVVNDDVHGAALAVEHLAALGHKRIAMIDGGNGAGAAERRSGYQQAMTRLGLADQIRIAPGDFTEEGGYAGARKLLAANPPTAVFASNDLAALGALTAIEEAGLKVPDQMSLVGYDNTSLAALRQISLTTIDQPRREIGATAMKALLRRIENPKTPARRVVLRAQLVVRRTTAAPATIACNDRRS
jgi:DNA-binding LacI/PurR family transcriptional regulator